jgi:hypothetical protein
MEAFARKRTRWSRGTSHICFSGLPLKKSTCHDSPLGYAVSSVANLETERGGLQSFGPLTRLIRFLQRLSSRRDSDAVPGGHVSTSHRVTQNAGSIFGFLSASNPTNDGGVRPRVGSERTGRLHVAVQTKGCRRSYSNGVWTAPRRCGVAAVRTRTGFGRRRADAVLPAQSRPPLTSRFTCTGPTRKEMALCGVVLLLVARSDG